MEASSPPWTRIFSMVNEAARGMVSGSGIRRASSASSGDGSPSATSTARDTRRQRPAPYSPESGGPKKRVRISSDRDSASSGRHHRRHHHHHSTTSHTHSSSSSHHTNQRRRGVSPAVPTRSSRSTHAVPSTSPSPRPRRGSRSSAQDRGGAEDTDVHMAEPPLPPPPSSSGSTTSSSRRRSGGGGGKTRRTTTTEATTTTRTPRSPAAGTAATPPALDLSVLVCSPLMAPSTSPEDLKTHILELRVEPVQRVARPLLSRLMNHTLNRGIFNTPVNAEALNLPDYHRIVEHPMDLGTIKDRLQSLQYEQLEPFLSDVRLVFHNARIYNPSTNHVHKAAAQMSAEFEEELGKLSKKILRDAKRRAEHRCDHCHGRECGLCGEKCVKLEPVMLTCSGACNQRIRRGQQYYITRDGSRLWCQKCHTSLTAVLPPPVSYDPDLDLGDDDDEGSGGGGDEASSPSGSSGCCSVGGLLQYKRDLLKRAYDEDIPEPWIACHRCKGWFHQTCALVNPLVVSRAPDLPFECALCALGPDALELPTPWLHRARDTFFGAAEPQPLGGPGPVTVQAGPMAATLHHHPRSPTANSGNASPLTSHLSSSGESVAGYTTKESCDGSGSDTESEHKADDGPGAGIEGGDGMLGEAYDAARLPTTEMSAFMQDKVCEQLEEMGFEDAAASVQIRVVSSLDREWAVPTPIRDTFFGPDQKKLPQTLGYRSKAIMMFQTIDGFDYCLFCMYVQEYDDRAPDPNKGKVYISYLDSVEYFRPRTARTAVYHEIIISYLAWARIRGFKTAHLWACPPQRGNNFIFWCHPQHQRTPSKDRLLAWYRAMLGVAHERGVVTKVTNFFEQYFTSLLEDSHSTCPPLFEGDFWIEEASRVYVQRQRKRVTVSNDASPSQMARAFLRTLRLHPSAHAFNQPVDPESLNIPDYFTVIKSPMDLGTVAGKLRGHVYNKLSDMLADIRLVFDNAKRYNPPKHPVHVAACTLECVFRREWLQLVAKWKASKGVAANAEKALASSSLAERNPGGGDDSYAEVPSGGGGDDSTLPGTLSRGSSSASDYGDGDITMADAFDDEDGSSSSSWSRDSSKSKSGGGGTKNAPWKSFGQLVGGGSSENWLLHDLCKSVTKLKDDLMVLHLDPTQNDSKVTSRSTMAKAWTAYTGGFGDRYMANTVDPDREDISRPLVDGRHTLLEVSMFRNLQFDSRRRAKHATLALLHHLHFPEGGLDSYCFNCGGTLCDLRWHCSACPSLDLCDTCSKEAKLQCPNGHSLTPYHITSFSSGPGTS